MFRVKVMAKKRRFVEIEAEIGLNATNRQQMALTGWSFAQKRRRGPRGDLIVGRKNKENKATTRRNK